MVVHDLYPSKEALDAAVVSGSTGGMPETLDQLERASRQPGIQLGDKMTRSYHQSTKRVAGRQGKKTAQGKTPAKLLVAMTGKASAAKTAKGAEPVFAYIASLPQPQRGIAEGIDALAAKSLPDIQRAVKWGMAYYGVDGGWCFSSGAFVGHVK